MDKSGGAQLCDMGLTTASASHIFGSSLKSRNGGSFRQMAPELFLPNAVVTYGSDIFAFAMTCYEILNGQVPFHSISDPGVGYAIIRGERPARLLSPQGGEVPAKLWELIESCWDQEPSKRPAMRAVLDDVSFLRCHCVALHLPNL